MPGVPYCVWLGASTTGEYSSSLGGKASSLHKLLSAGIPVPQAFAITTSAFDASLQNVHAEAMAAYSAGKSVLPASLAAQITSAAFQIPDDVQSAILAFYKKLVVSIQSRTANPVLVSVRSSSVSEDSSGASFAGQHDTFLYVSSPLDVLDAVKKCWASVFSAASIAYRATIASTNSNSNSNSNGNGNGNNNNMGGKNHAWVPLDWERMCVVVQQMIDPSSSGVAFSLNPITYAAEDVCVEAGYGVGEGVVQGSVPTDQYIVDKLSMRVTSSQVSVKDRMVASVQVGGVSSSSEKKSHAHRQNYGTTVVKIHDAAKRTAPVLSDSQITEIAKTVLEIVHLYNNVPQDVEWCFDSVTSQLFILQARPVTKVYDRTDLMEPVLDIQGRCLYTRNDIGESFSGLKTPLSLSFGDMFNRRFSKSSFWCLGMPNSFEIEHFLRSFNGHMYINISFMTAAASQIALLRDDSLFVEKYGTWAGVDVSNYKNPFGIVPIHKTVLPTAYFIANMMREGVFGDARVKEAEAVRKVEEDRFLQNVLPALPSMTHAELASEFQRAVDLYHLACEWYFPLWLNVQVFSDEILKLARQHLGREYDTRFQQLSKFQSVTARTVELTEALSRLAEAAKVVPEVRTIMCCTPVDRVRDALLGSDAGKKFWQDHMWPFLTSFGIRGSQEMELTTPRWIDEPVFVFKMVRKYIEDGFDFQSEKTKLEHGVQADAEQREALLAKLPAVRRVQMRKFIKDYVAAGEAREIARPSWVLATWFLHRITKEIGVRLAALGVLAHPSHVAYTTMYELAQWLALSEPTASNSQNVFSRAKIEHFRKLHEYRKSLPDPPFSFIGRPVYPDLTKLGSEDLIRGIAASSGTVRGVVRLILDLDQEANSLQKGEILVTKATDPAWTPLFVEAAAVVAETGGLLSHTSIVAREFGIPAIVNAPNITHLVRSGDVVEVDGTNGTIRICQRAR
eukprot:ANDGO_08459.mRNA.1 Prodigiosin synthesizing transferase PigC